MLSAAVYGAAFYTLREKVAHDLHRAEIQGFKLFLDGIVIDRIKSGPMVFSRVYFHGNPWQLYRAQPDYINILHAQIMAGNILSAPIDWPLSPDIPLVVEKLSFSLPLMGRDMAMDGTAKQDPETPLLIDFQSQDKALDLQGQVEIRLDKNRIGSVDLEFHDASIDLDGLQTKRMSGWLSYSFENDWQVIGEIESGFAAAGDRHFSEASLKVNGQVISPDATFSGNENGQVVEINRHSGNVTLQKDARVFPVLGTALNHELLQNIDLTLGKLEQLLLAEKQETEIAAAEKPVDKPPEKPPEPPSETPVVLPPAPVPVVKQEPVRLPEVRLEKLVQNSVLHGFSYTETLVPVAKPDGTWTAHGSGGMLNYDDRQIPAYFIKLKDYEQSKTLQSALLNFVVQTMTVKGIRDQVLAIDLKGVTASGQPAEIQLSVSGL